MTAKLICCLCYMPAAHDYKQLQNDSAEYNDFYNITIQYFSPKLLSEHICAKQLEGGNVLCQNCWSHIQDFHDFKQTVLKSRTSLYEINIKNYNHMYGVAKSSPSILSINNDQIDAVLNSDDSDSEVEIQYALVMDDSDSEIRITLEQIDIPKSPLHINGDEFQHPEVHNNDSSEEPKTSLEQAITLNTSKTNFQTNSVSNYEYNNFSNEALTSLKRLSMPKSPLHIKVEEFQYFSGCNNDVVNETTKKAFENTSIQKSPLHIKVEEFQYSSGCNNDVVNETTKKAFENTSIQKSPLHIKVEEFQYSSGCNNDVVNETTKKAFENTSIQKSPLHIKVENETDTTAWNGDFGNIASNSILPINMQTSPTYFGSEGWTSRMYTKVEDQTTASHNNDNCSSTEFQQNQSGSGDLMDIGQNNKILNNNDYDETPLYKSKISCRENKHLFSSDDDVGDDDAIKSKTFSTEYKSQQECDICGEACGNKLLKVNFKKQPNNKNYYKCFDRYYHICGKLNSCKQTIIYDKLQEFKCNYCPEAFKNRTLLKRHIAARAKGNRGFKCEKCCKSYFKESQLKRHTAAAHVPKSPFRYI